MSAVQDRQSNLTGAWDQHIRTRFLQEIVNPTRTASLVSLQPRIFSSVVTGHQEHLSKYAHEQRGGGCCHASDTVITMMMRICHVSSDHVSAGNAALDVTGGTGPSVRAPQRVITRAMKLRYKGARRYSNSLLTYGISFLHVQAWVPLSHIHPLSPAYLSVAPRSKTAVGTSQRTPHQHWNRRVSTGAAGLAAGAPPDPDDMFEKRLFLASAAATAAFLRSSGFCTIA
eukprot:768444-Hanusia_phi.AAC.2